MPTFSHSLSSLTRCSLCLACVSHSFARPACFAHLLVCLRECISCFCQPAFPAQFVSVFVRLTPLLRCCCGRLLPARRLPQFMRTHTFSAHTQRTKAQRHKSRMRTAAAEHSQISSTHTEFTTTNNNTNTHYSCERWCNI